MARDRGATSHQINNMLQKLTDPDPDIRFMQLSDLHGILSANTTEWIRNDPNTAGRIIEGILKALTDQHGEVQNEALRW